MADTILFDKLTYLDRLKRAGIDDHQARAHAEAMEEALRESVATKSDIARLENKIETDIARLETKIEADITRLENKIEADTTRLENKIETDITRLETKIGRLENKIETDIALAVRDMTIRMGAIAVALFAALASIKFFG